jgi:hypothetical protein
MQWYQDKDPKWAQQNCRMIPYIQFDLRGFSEPIANSFGLQNFKDYFAMRARSQYRLPSTITGDVQIWHDDGMAFALYEIGTFSGKIDTFYAEAKVVAKVAHPEPTVWVPQTIKGVTLEAGKIYVADVKYWQRWGHKGLKVRISHAPLWMSAVCLVLQ